MVQSTASTVEAYLAELPADRRQVVQQVREVVLAHLPKGYVEAMNWGMISYEIPLELYPDTYNGRPLAYAALAAQKNHYSIYLMNIYGDPEAEARLREAFVETGKKLDMGKSCVRFRKLENMPLGVIGEIIASTPPQAYIARYEASRKS